MARKLRVQFEGAIYHVTLRGVERRRIFSEDRERERFIERVADGVETHGVRLYLYCLMGNHAHLVLETPRGNIEQFMHGLNTAYSVYFNLRHGRVGHLFQGRYGSVLVEGNEYLLRLTRYLHLNPVFTKETVNLPVKERMQRLRDYPWSSYRGYARKASIEDFVDYGPLLHMFPGKESRRRLAYRRFVEGGIARSDDEFLEIKRESSLAIGSDEFRDRVRDRYDDLVEKRGRKEDVSLRRRGRTLDSRVVLQVVCQQFGVDEAEVCRQRKTSWVRPVVAKMLCKHAGLTQRDAASVIGLKTGAAVSLQLKRFRAGMAEDRNLARKVGSIERSLPQQANLTI